MLFEATLQLILAELQFFNKIDNGIIYDYSCAYHNLWNLQLLLFLLKISESPGSGCSKLMTSLINISLKFQTF